MNALDYVNIFEFQISVQVNRGVGNQAQNSYKFLIFFSLVGHGDLDLPCGDEGQA